MDKPQKWTDVFPYGTKEGDEESKFFKALARSKSDWISSVQIARTANLDRDRVEEILEKYVRMSPPLIYAHETSEDLWAYWERVPELVEKLQINQVPVSEKDKMARVDKQLGQDDPAAKTAVVNEEQNWSLDL